MAITSNLKQIKVRSSQSSEVLHPRSYLHFAAELRGIEPVLAPRSFDFTQGDPEYCRTGRLGKLSEDNFHSLYVANKKSGSKKLPWVKLCLASASLLILTVVSKNLFASSSKTLAINPHSAATPAVLGDQVSQNQAQPATAGSTTTTPEPTQDPAAASAPAVAPLPAPVTKNIKIKVTPTGYLNVRLQPSLDSLVISKVYPGEIHAYTSAQDGWYLIQLKSKHYGWVNAEYVAVITNN